MEENNVTYPSKFLSRFEDKGKSEEECSDTVEMIQEETESASKKTPNTDRYNTSQDNLVIIVKSDTAFFGILKCRSLISAIVTTFGVEIRCVAAGCINNKEFHIPAPHRSAVIANIISQIN